MSVQDRLRIGSSSAAGEYFETWLPCDPSGLTRFRRALGDAGVEELLAKTIELAVSIKAIAPKDLERVIVDSTVQEKAIAFPTDSRLLDVARRKLVLIAKRAGGKHPAIPS